MSYTIHQGNNIDILKTYPDNHFDSIVTDPPYGIDFLGKGWDANTGALETYQQCLRVLKPGGHILAFSAARTYHHLAITLEQAGFEIRDQIMWLYASGFPKAQDVGKSIQKRMGVKETKPARPGINAYANDKPLMERMSFANLKAEDYPPKNAEIICTSIESKQWAGWKTALKPAHEPICMARKPFSGSTVDNVLKHGVGALNIDATRISFADQEDKDFVKNTSKTFEKSGTKWTTAFNDRDKTPDSYEINQQGRFPSNVLGEVADYQKYFYCPKVSRKERHTGFESPPDPVTNYSQGDVKNHPLWDPSIGTNVQRLKHKILENNKDLGKKTLDHIPTAPGSGLNQMYGEGQGAAHKRPNIGNNHPTVKPVALMRYLIQLVTPANSTVLDPFCGSGSTGMAAVELGHTFVGCELDPAYVEISQTRIAAWNKPELPPEFFSE